MTIVKGKRYLITGGSGFLGINLIERIINQGGIVRTVARNEGKLIQLKERFGNKIEIYFGDTAELYGIDSILRVDEAKYQLQAITELKGCKFDPAGATGIMQMIFNSLNGATSGTGTITDTNTMYLMDVYVYEVGSVTPGSNLFAAVIYNAYLEGVPIPFTENDFVTLDLKFHGRTAAITSAACPTS